ncbi:MAG: chemotaxis response regulator protein-glutamate methylesterase [Chloroflexi bacterium]|nr:chemotaxis response regulator protein-glutamate methylesterase [Chloroflexota bacterium]
MSNTSRDTTRDTRHATPIRVLVVDDSAYMRFTLSKYLSEAPGLAVAGTARDGAEALELILKLQPDVVTLDVEMPHMDGLTALREIMTSCPLPVVMLSSLTTEGASETVQALTWGAVDFVAKPSAKANVAVIMEEVVGKVRAAAQARVSRVACRVSRVVTCHSSPVTRHSFTTRALRSGDKVVVIGASTGGPRALYTVVPQLPKNLAAAVLIVQHMPVGFTRSLAERLNAVSPLAVKEAGPGDALEVGRALLAPGGFHMTVDADSRVALNQAPTVHGVRPAVDVTLTSVAQRLGARSVGVILTGMGRDGTDGAGLIHRAGGRVIAEDESTCVVWGMPRSVAEAGVADVIAPLAEIPAAIERMVKE